MAALSLFCERAWVDYSFETCIGLPSYLYCTSGKPSWGGGGGGTPKFGVDLEGMYST